MSTERSCGKAQPQHIAGTKRVGNKASAAAGLRHSRAPPPPGKTRGNVRMCPIIYCRMIAVGSQFSAIRTRGSREQRKQFLPLLGGEGRGEGGLQTKIKLRFRIFRQALRPPHEPRFQRDAADAGVRASFVVSGNDRPHPDLLPRGEGTAIACVSLCGCASGESSRGCLVVQGFKARVSWEKSLLTGG